MPVSPEMASILNGGSDMGGGGATLEEANRDKERFTREAAQAQQAVKLGLTRSELEGLNTPEQGLIPPEVGKPAAQQARAEATKTSGQLFRNVAVPVAQAGLTMALPGVGGAAAGVIGGLGRAAASAPGQALIGAGLEYGLQKAGLNPSNPTSIGLQAAVPFASKVVEGIKGMGRFGANVLGHGQQAGEQAIAARLGEPLKTVERVGAAPATEAYNAARAAGPIDVSAARSAVTDALAKETAMGSQGSTIAKRKLEGILTDFADTSGTMDADTMVAKAQRLQAAARDAYKSKNSVLGKALDDATQTFKQSIPNLQKADEIYTRQDVVEKVFKAARSSNKVKAIDDLLSKEGKKIKGAMSDSEIEDIRRIASRIVDQGGDTGAGILKTGYEAGLRSFLADPNGITVFRHAFGPTMDRLSPERLAGMMTFVRAYNAQNQRK